MGRMGRVRTHMAVVSSGWGPSGRRFKSGLADYREPAWEAGLRSAARALTREHRGEPNIDCWSNRAWLGVGLI